MASDIEAQLDRIERLVDSLALSTQNGFTALAERFEKRFIEVDKRFEQVDKRFDQIDEHFDRMDRRLGNIETRVEDLETETRAFRMQAERRLTTLESRSD